MKTIKGVVVIIALAAVFSVAMYVIKHNQMALVAAEEPSEVDKVAPDRDLSDRLIRFGQVAFDRGQIAEAKHFFQKAIKVDPDYPLAWKKYNMALLGLVTSKVQSDPVYLPEFQSNGGFPTSVGVPAPDASPPQISPDSTDDDDDC